MNDIDLLMKYFPELTKEQQELYIRFGELFREWNEKINLVSRKDIDSLFEKHILHSLGIAKVIRFSPGTSILDVGTGGGFPGIPLAICFPDVHFHLVDSINKKLKVAHAIAAEIGLKNVTVHHTRAEDIKDKKFDVVVSRAVAPLKNLWYWSKPLLHKRPVHQAKRVTGLICLKGGDLSKEIHESGLHPQVWEIENIFQEPFFKDKYILAVN